MSITLSDGHGLLGNKLKKEPNTSHCDKSGCRRFKVAQSVLKMDFEHGYVGYAMSPWVAYRRPCAALFVRIGCQRGEVAL